MPPRCASIQRKLAALALLIVICIAASGTRCSEAGAPTESQVKAAFVFNFAKFVEWPANAFDSGSSPIRITIVGDSGFADAVDQAVKGKTIDGRKLSIKRSDGKQIDSCHILFISETEKKRTDKIVDSVKDAPTLLVGETNSFIESGGVIGFVMVDKKVTFEINNGLAKKHGLKISSQLLKLAKRVKE